MATRNSKEQMAATAKFEATHNGDLAAKALRAYADLNKATSQQHWQINACIHEFTFGIPKLEELIRGKSSRRLLIKALHAMGQITDEEYKRFKRL